MRVVILLHIKNRDFEDVGVQAIVVPKLKLGDIEWKIFMADLMEVAHNASLAGRPEALNRVCMNRANDVLTFVVINGFVREPMLQSVRASRDKLALAVRAGADYRRHLAGQAEPRCRL
jgi:hypothetical protein